ncbi:hypothetical protein GDO81_002090 [Engystomops pustulosus]|uniref:Uncharacterized protein n=1 Tax=Engystomops pustulosus TaxID=76066 RepID=A0AAV7DI80_ENGPU|nr:hypothetical protein GDO81_002090 [Engystomops pustulosus]
MITSHILTIYTVKVDGSLIHFGLVVITTKLCVCYYCQYKGERIIIMYCLLFPKAKDLRNFSGLSKLAGCRGVLHPDPPGTRFKAWAYRKSKFIVYHQAANC